MTHSSRTLKTHLIQRKTKYLELTLKKFKQQNLLTAAQNLQQAAINQGHWTEELQEKYENIDRQATNIMIKAEQQCAPQFPSLITWSTKLGNQGLLLRYLNRYKRFLYGHNIQPQTLLRLAQQAGVTHEVYTLT